MIAAGSGISESQKSQSGRIRTRTMRILLASHGTRGDVQPILALAVALRARGHVVLLTVPGNFVSWVRSYGFDTESDGTDVEALLRSAGSNLQSLSWQMRYLSHITPLVGARNGVTAAVEHIEALRLCDREGVSDGL